MKLQIPIHRSPDGGFADAAYWIDGRDGQATPVEAGSHLRAINAEGETICMGIQDIAWVELACKLMTCGDRVVTIDGQMYAELTIPDKWIKENENGTESTD